jgi:hypothetical protein
LALPLVSPSQSDGEAGRITETGVWVEASAEGEDAMIASKEDVALDLARSHAEAEPGIKAIYRLMTANEDSDAEPIKLLEVNENTVEQGIEPIRFGPDEASGVYFASVVVDVSPREFEAIQQRRLSLPHGWSVGLKLIG